MSIPRGIRNNNPGNIRHGESWNGLADDQPDEAFCVFVDAEHGIRAMAKVLLTYERKYGLTSVRQIISRWAPPSENNTLAYVQHVADVLGVTPDERVSVRERLEDLVDVIIRHENGANPYEPEQVMIGCDWARS